MRKYGGGAPCRPYCRRAVVKFRCSISSGGGSRSGGGGGDRQRNGAARRTLLLGGAGGALVAAGGAQHRGSLLNPWPALAADGGGDADLASAASARRLERALERRVTRFQLANGMTFVVAERPAGSAPIFAASTYVNAGAWQERDGRGGEAGETGAAHLLEHLAFKGTPRVGSRDWRREGALLRAVDEAFYALRDARREGRVAAVARLEAEFDALQAAAQELVVPNAFAQTLTAAGAVGLNAATSHDATRYYASLPARRLELWFALESERFQAPTFRELYREKQVVAEERAARIDNSPAGRLFSDLSLRALANNYRRPVLGFAADLDAMGRREIADFFARFYHPANVTVCIAGAVAVAEVRRLAERYFGGWRALDAAAAVTVRHAGGAGGGADVALEPSARPMGPLPAQSSSQAGLGVSSSNSSSYFSSNGSSGSGPTGGVASPPPLDYATASRAGPLAVLGFYRPGLLAPGGRGVALEAACDVLTAGRTSRLQRLVQEGRLLAAGATPDFPAELHPGLALVTARPRPGESPQRAAALLQAQLDALAASGPTPAELARVAKAARTELLGALQSNAGLAAALAVYEATTGSWRGALAELAGIEALTCERVRDVAAETFDPRNGFAALVDLERSQAAV